MASDQPGFFDVEHRLQDLSAQGDPLEKLAATVDFEMFRDELERAIGRPDRSKGGRPPLDAVLKFRMLVLQAMHGLSLAQTEYLVGRSAELDAVLQARSRRQRARREHAVGFSRGADRRRRAGGAVRAAGPRHHGSRLSADVRPDRRRHAGGRPAPAADGRGEGGHQGRPLGRARSGPKSPRRRARRTPTRAGR